MSDIDDEMKSTADYAVKAAKERFKQDLDYSDQSIARIDKILGQIYWGFSNHPKGEGQDGLVFNTAIIWGSYLGEYMRLKWGGSWIQKGTDRLISIKDNEFSPIDLVYQKITSYPEYSMENYLIEAKRIISTSVINQQQAQARSEKIDQQQTQARSEKIEQQRTQSQPEIVNQQQVQAQPEIITPLVKKIPVQPAIRPISIDKRVIYALAGFVGLLLVSVACIIGYGMIKSGGLPAFGVIASPTTTNTDLPTGTALSTATAYSTDTPLPTVTMLPTYTPVPTFTPSPSSTPEPTSTETPTLAPTDTETPFPTRTRTPRPTNTPKPPTQPPAPTDTEVPPTRPPLPEIVSCDINPSSVPSGEPKDITFIVNFSVTGYGFSVAGFDPTFPGQGGCSGSADSNGRATCTGSSGLLPDSTTVNVTLSTDLGNCTASYSTP